MDTPCNVICLPTPSLGHDQTTVLIEPHEVYLMAYGEDRFDSLILTVDDLDTIRTCMARLEGARP